MRTAEEILTAFAETDQLGEFKRFYLVGIGGAGMSGLALMLHHRGFSVQGSDSTPSPMIDDLEARGIPVRIGHSGDGISPGLAVILSDAIPLDAPEPLAAIRQGMPLFRRSQLLGWLLRGKRTIAITGTHGKTTTTGMVGAALRAAGLDPTIVVGAAVPEFGGPIVEGHGDIAVVEACEAYDSYHDLDPSVIVLTNLEPDHLDYHGSFEGLQKSVRRFVDKLASNPNGGDLFFCASDAGAAEMASHLDASRLRAHAYGAELPDGMRVPGVHNAMNASGALAAAVAVGADRERALEGIRNFRGAERRLQVLLEGPITVVDDYAHHPTEITASLGALRQRYPDRRLIVVFQPHLYSRTKDLIPEFAESLDAADFVFVTDIYPAREAPIPGISSARIAEHLSRPHEYVPSRHLLPRFVARMASPGDLVVGMGAGNIGEFAPDFVRELDRGAPRRVAVLQGGDSAEREVSLLSGRAISAALERLGYEVQVMDATELLLRGGRVEKLSGPLRPDLVFLALHGTHAEDGAIQGLLELLHLPYTGSGIQASALAMDKALTKDILIRHGIPVPEGVVVNRSSSLAGLQAPAVVKPNAQGSTVGLSFVEQTSDLKPAVERALSYGDEALVETWLRGVEVSVPVLHDRALPVVEIAPKSGRYDFASKYTPGATEEIVPARISPRATEVCQDYAVRAHQALGCAGATRTDMIVVGDEAWVLEINTLPGMTGTSLLPNSAAAAGMTFDNLVQWIVEDALRRFGART